MIRFFVFILIALWGLAEAFEPYPYRNVPFPANGLTMSSERRDQWVETLCMAAASGGFNDTQRQRFVAAARRLAPLNRKAIVTEYQLSLGEPATEVVSGASADSVREALRPFLEELKSEVKAAEFLAFIASAIDRESASVSILHGKPGIHRLSFLSTSGCIALSGRVVPTDSTVFQFRPGNLDSPIFQSAYREALKFLGLSHASDLVGKRIEFLLEGTLSQEEGPAAALACAVITHAVARGITLDPETAFSGDVNADGTVQPIGDQRERLTIKPETLARVVVIPKRDEFAADDTLLLHGPSLFTRIQLLSVETLDQAVSVGSSQKTAAQVEAMKLFDQIGTVLNKEGAKLLTNSHVVKRLDRVVELMPNHLSARQLKLAAINRYPPHLSLDGSFELVFTALKPLLDEKRAISPNARLNPSDLAKLKQYRQRLDPELGPLADALFLFDSSGRVGSDSINERVRVTQKLKEEINALSRNLRLREKMM